MNILVFTVWAAAQYGGQLGVAPIQTGNAEGVTGGTPVVQLVTLQSTIYRAGP